MKRLLLGLLVVLLTTSAHGNVLSMGPGLTSLEMVPVGNPGNDNDVHGYGSAAEPHLIGRYEVTAGQYTEFLNAVAADDTYELYSGNMWLSDYGCKIKQSGSSGSLGRLPTPTRGYRTDAGGISLHPDDSRDRITAIEWSVIGPRRTRLVNLGGSINIRHLAEASSTTKAATVTRCLGLSNRATAPSNETLDVARN